MRIKKIQLKNGYKRFHDLTIELGETPKRIIALVGANGCGKSSVLDGMLFLNNAHHSLGNKGGKNHEYHSMNKTPNFPHTNVLIDFVEGSFNSVNQIKTQTGKENTIFSFRSPYRYNSNLKVNQSQATTEIRLNNYGATASSDLDDKMEQNYRRLYIKFNKYLRENSATATYDSTKEKIIGDLNNSLTNCLELQVSSLGDIEAGEGTLFFKKPDHPNEFEFNVLSSGEKEVVDILLDLYLRQDEYDDTIFLIDEPELHINTSIQKKLLIEINKLIGTKCQIWIATHSIGFLRALQEDLREECQIIYFPKSVNWASTIQTLSPIKKTLDNWKEIFETALDDLTGLISPKKIIYCEGNEKPTSSGKEKGLDATVFNNIFSEKYNTSLFVSSGGHTELDQRSSIALIVLKKAFLDVEMFILKDRDFLSNKKATLKDRKKYLTDHSDSHRMLKRWEIENYLYDKEVLQKYCNENSLTFDEPGYNALVTSIKNQNLKDSTGKIKKICNLRKSISKENFKIALSKVITEDMSVYKELEKEIFKRR